MTMQQGERAQYERRIERYGQAAKASFEVLRSEDAVAIAIVVLEKNGDMHTGMVVDGDHLSPEEGEAAFRRLLASGPHRLARWCKALLCELGVSNQALSALGFCDCHEQATPPLTPLN